MLYIAAVVLSRVVSCCVVLCCVGCVGCVVLVVSCRVVSCRVVLCCVELYFCVVVIAVGGRWYCYCHLVCPFVAAARSMVIASYVLLLLC